MIQFYDPADRPFRFDPYGNAVGYLAMFFSEMNPKSAREQANDGYQHGGGWFPFPGMDYYPDRLVYPGSGGYPDEVYRLVAYARLRDETIRLYDSAWVAIVQSDGTFEVARMD